MALKLLSQGPPERPQDTLDLHARRSVLDAAETQRSSKDRIDAAMSAEIYHFRAAAYSQPGRLGRQLRLQREQPAPWKREAAN